MSWSSVSSGEKGASAWANKVQNALGDGTPAQGANYVIFKDGSTYKARNGTTGVITYSGTEMHTIFQNCLNNLDSDKGGTVVLHPHLTWTNTVTCTQDFTTIIWLGRTEYTGTGYCLVMGDGSVRLKTPTLINPWIHGVYADYTTGSGIQFNSCTNGLIFNPDLVYFNTCIHLKASATQNCVWNSIVNPNLREVSSKQTLGTGISITKDGTPGANANTIWGGVIGDSSLHAGTIGLNITGGDTNKIYATDFAALTTAVYLGDNALQTEFYGPRLEECTTGFAKQSASNSYHKIFGGSFATVTTKFTNFTSGTDVIKNIHGYVTENSGSNTITSGTTSRVVAHGLGGTPSAEDIIIIGKEDPTNSVGTIWVDTIGAVNFTVNVENDPGASNWDFGWKVIKTKW